MGRDPLHRVLAALLLGCGLAGSPAAGRPQAAAIPPLDSEALAALAAASDGLDRRDEAWHRLLEGARAWPTDPDSLRAAIDAAPTVRRPDWGGWLLEPDPHRGSLVRLRGRLEQETAFEWPTIRGDESPPRLAEWFVRLEAVPGEDPSPPTVQCWVVDPPRSAAGRGPREVEVVGRFLRVTEERSRDGVARRWHTFVGVAMPPQDPAMAASPEWLLPAVVMGMLALVVWLRRLGRGGRSGGASPRPTPSDEAPPPPRGDLPTDPAEALAVLRQEASPSAAGDRP
jgi:hypothetical protein